jgi:hypothetical protein
MSKIIQLSGNLVFWLTNMSREIRRMDTFYERMSLLPLRRRVLPLGRRIATFEETTGQLFSYLNLKYKGFTS